MSFYTLSAFTDECAAATADQLAALPELGIGAMEVRFLDGKNISTLTDGEITAFIKEKDRLGVKISSIGSPIGKIPLNGDRAAHLDTAKRLFSYAEGLGTSFARIFSFYLPEGMTRKDCYAETVDAVGELIEAAKPYGVTLCHENEAGIYGEGPDDCADLLSALPDLGCVFDMGNFTLGGYDPIAAYERLAKRITYFHIKDGRKDGTILPPDHGDAKIGEILARYKAEIGKPTYLTLEPHLRGFIGLSALTDRTFDLPYHFETDREAFFFAAAETKKILERIDR